MSISSSENERPHWRVFIAVLLGATAAILSVAAIFVAVVDPYDSLAFSPNWKRYRVTSNERFSFSGLIRHNNFDSAVFGTSTIMLLKPSDLSQKLGGRFVNLAMSAGTAWEQAQLMKFYASHNKQPIRTVLIGIDEVWCAMVKPTPLLTQQPAAPWQYDDNLFNDYAHLLNTRALYHATLQLLTMTGVLRPRYPDDMYSQFTPDDDRYDPVRVHSLLYALPNSPRAADLTLPDPGPLPADWIYPDLRMLFAAIERFSPQTRKILMFMPYHLTSLAVPGNWSKFTYCKSAVLALARTKSNTAVIDFMRPSALTRNDNAYWDSVHYRIGYAGEIIKSLNEAFVENTNAGQLYEVLLRPQMRQP